MGKSRNKARAMKHKLTKKMSKSGPNEKILKCLYWNSNGMQCLCKQQELIDLMEWELLDLVMVDETHFKRNSNIDLSAFDAYSPIFIERGFGEKSGGGKMILLSKKFHTIKWSPSIEEKEWINNERVWILFQNSKDRIAICSVYMACESPLNNDFKTWNDMIYAELEKELKVLENDGYKCVIVGDLKSVFIIINAIKEARRKHKTISIAFCDIAKAYVSVCRELLYTKLRFIGFGGRVVSLIRSMYYNDSIRVSLTHGLSAPLYFTQGVKQGCSLSPPIICPVYFISGNSAA